MAEYQNIFTSVQIRAPAYAGVPLKGGSWIRQGKPGFSHFFGRFGDALTAVAGSAPVVVAGDLRQRRADAIEGRGHGHEKLLPGGRQLQPAATLEQLHAEQILERADLAADGAVRHAKFNRRVLETRVPRSRLERTNGVERWQGSALDGNTHNVEILTHDSIITHL